MVIYGNMNNFEEIVRRSIRKDFENAHFKKLAKGSKTPHPANTKRVLSLNENCQYYKFRRFFEKHLVRLLRESIVGGTWVEFVNDVDRKQLNDAAGWSDLKREYLLQGAKFDD